MQVHESWWVGFMDSVDLSALTCVGALKNYNSESIENNFSRVGKHNSTQDIKIALENQCVAKQKLHCHTVHFMEAF